MTRNKNLKRAERAKVAAELAQMYAAGSTIRSIAAQTGRSYGAVRQLLIDAKVPLRARGGGIRKAGA